MIHIRSQGVNLSSQVGSKRVHVGSKRGHLGSKRVHVGSKPGDSLIQRPHRGIQVGKSGHDFILYLSAIQDSNIR